MAPSVSKIQEIFHPLFQQGQQSQFFDHVSPTVHWTILGHSPMSKAYTSLDDFRRETLEYLGTRVLTSPLRLRVTNIVGGGEGSEWATVEMEAVDAVCKNGLKYDMRYCWTVRFDPEDQDVIVEVRAYLDTKLLCDAIEQNP